MCQALGWKVFIDGEIIRLWVFSLEDVKLYIRRQSRDFESRKSDFYLERLWGASEFRAMRNKSKQNGKRWQCWAGGWGQVGNNA